MQLAVDTSDTHDDFKTVYKGDKPAGDAMSQIKQDIEGHDVFLYMKGVPGAPQCGFSNMACQVLHHYGKSHCTPCSQEFHVSFFSFYGFRRGSR